MMKRTIAIAAVTVTSALACTIAGETNAPATKQVDFADLIQQSSGPGIHVMYEKGYEDTPFTGTAVLKFKDGRKTTTEFKNGKGNGLSIMWHANGKKAMQVTLVDDKPDGVMIKWDENGKELSRTTYANGKEVKPDKNTAQQPPGN
jgi:hypothetical protein